jgi:hypothetical protein
VPELAEKKEQAPRQGVPPETEAKLKRGREGLRGVVARRLLGIEFANGNHFSELSEDNSKVTNLSTAVVTLGGEKPDHRVRRSHDIITPMLKRKMSSATQREPDWESMAATTDPEDYAASRIAQRIARVGYALWGFPTAEAKALWWSMVTEETFGRASWNGNVGPFVDVSQHPEADYEDGEGNKPYAGQPDPDNPKWRGRGEIGITVYSGLEVLWEPGVDFEESRWYAVEHARSIEEVEGEEGFLHVAGEKLKADAQTVAEGRSTAREKKGTNLVMVTEYFERPCSKHPKGKWSTFANGRKAFKDENYPQLNADGEVVDEPCLRRLVYDIDASSDRAKGLIQQIIDPVRSYDQAINKQSEYSQIGLVAQIMAAEGVLLTDPTDEPGLVLEYDRTLANGEKPEWRDNIDFPSELFEMEERAKRRFSDISFDQDIPANVESGSAIGQVIELNRVAWSKFLNDFDRFRSDLMSDCLVIAQRKYSSDRLLKFRGTMGWESVDDFEGADLRNQTDVRIRQSATQMQTRPQIEQRIMQLVQTFPNVFPPEVVIEALNSATPEKLIEGYEEDVGRAHRTISRLRDGTFLDQPPRPVLPGEEAPELDPATGLPVLNPETGEPVMLTQVEGWLPRPFDSIPILKSAVEQWMKSDDWDRSDQDVKKASLIYYRVLLDQETKKAQRDAELQSQLAEEQGMANATRESDKPMPSLPGGSPQPGGGNGEEPPTANEPSQ